MSIKATIDDLRKYRSLILVIFLFCMISTLSFLATGNMSQSSAASLNNFNPGNIISDAVMGNYNSMTKEAIQQFLTKKNPCNNTNVTQYQNLKKQYPHLDWHFENGHFVCLSEERFGDGNTIGQGQTAAEIIYQAAQDYRINPQVLLVLLEKEQSLVTDTYPNTKQYRSATGYGCPDTAACDSKYYGFKNQVRQAAALFRNVLDHGYSAYPEKTKGVYVSYNPSSACGRSEVYIENRATAALYRYTPYQPNAAALRAGYGSGDGCSAYGNRNFYLYFTNWFGSTQITVDGDAIVLPDGEYGFMSAKTSGTVLSVSGDKVQVVGAKAGNNAQRWRTKRDPATGYYAITNLANQQLLSAAMPIANGTKVQTAKANDSCTTKWKLYQTADGYLTFESACSAGYVIDADINGNISTWLTHGGLNQKWSIYSGPVLQNGMYQIAAALDQNKVLDINAGNDANGAKITIWQQYQSKGHQVWQLQYQAAGDYYTITNPYTGKSLNANVSGNNYNNAKVALWEKNTNCGQKWKIIALGNNTYSLHSVCSVAYVLDLNGSTANGTGMSLWRAHGGKNQQWLIRTATPPVANGTYSVTSRLANKASFDIINGVSQDGANVAIWQLHGGVNQQWQLTYNPTDGSYKIYNAYTKHHLSLASQTANNGNNIQMQTDNNTCATKWYIYPESDNYYRITSACHTLTAIDLNNGFTNGNNITIWQAHGGKHQQWAFSKI